MIAIAIAGLPAATLPAMAQPAPDMLVSGVQPGDRVDEMIVTVTILNRGASPRAGIPASIAAELAVDDRSVAATLERVDADGGPPIPPGGFGERAYRLRLPADAGAVRDGVLSLSGSGAGFAFRIADDESQALASAAEEVSPPPPASSSAVTASLADAPPSAKPDGGNAFLGNLSSYQPIYGVYGPGTNSDGRLQISFKYQLFGDPGAVGGDNPVINGIHFAYTQRMFWDLGANSSPFRNIDFMPEIFYLLPARAVGNGIALGGQAGLRHESNGRDGDASRSMNMLYIQPVATLPVGDYTLSIGPRFWVYTGRTSDNPDIRRYRGNTGLLLEIGEDDGFRLTTDSRMNFSSGKGAVEAELSYPLDRIVETGLNLYLFGQAFTGYGENLLDYNRRTSRLRFGIGIVR